MYLESASAINLCRTASAYLAMGMLLACSPNPTHPTDVVEPSVGSMQDESVTATAVKAASADEKADVPVTNRPARRTPPPRRLTLALVGDMMLGTDHPRDHLPDDDGESFLRHVSPLLRAADLTIGNLEGVLADTAEPAKVCSNLDACYLFRSPTRYADHFLAAGFDALSLANNHARDFGEEGRTSTMLALSERGIAHSGRKGEFASISWQGLDVSFVAFSVTRNSNLVHDYRLAAEIVTAEALEHDLVIVSFHGGAEGEGTMRIPFAEEEYFGEPRGDVVRFARSMVDAGADLVFGHGPHVVRGMERYKDRLIAYSLGNFATYYGISVNGNKGIAPILAATLDERGRFLEGWLHSTVQVRPGGPQLDAKKRALNLIRELSQSDFREPGLSFRDDGRLLPSERRYVKPHTGAALQ